MKNPGHRKPLECQDVPATSILRDNVERKEKFRTRTIIEKELGKNVVYKYATIEQAKQFIRTVAEREKKNAEYLRGQFDVLVGLLQGDRIKYDYLALPSVQDEIGRHMRERRMDEANALLENFINRINALQSVRTVPEEFLKTIAGSPDDDLCVDCLQRGLLDLKPGHVLINGDKWIVLDNEWSFDFPVPICFILFRAIRETAYFLQREIRESASKALPVIGTFCLGSRTYYLPVDWLEHILDTGISLRRMLYWEMGFQQYVTGADCDSVGRIKLHRNVRTHFNENESLVSKKLRRFLRRYPKLKLFAQRIESKLP